MNQFDQKKLKGTDQLEYYLVQGFNGQMGFISLNIAPHYVMLNELVLLA